MKDNFDVGIIPVPGLLTGSGTTAGRSVKTEVNAVKGWSIGCPIENLTAFGTTPTWTSVRRRYWKNQAEKAQVNPTAYEYNATQIERMKKGLAPQRENPITGEIETMELHHIPPRREGGLFDFEELWPDQHAAVDEFRRLGK